MKKLGFMMSLMLGLFVSVCALTACSSDDDDDNNSSNPLVGTWYTIGSGGKDEETIYTEITYKADYTCTWREYKADQTTIIGSDTGTYEINGNALYIWWEREKKYWQEDGPWTTTFSINGNKMTTTEKGGTTWTKK